jgi:hypothetical protein
MSKDIEWEDKGIGETLSRGRLIVPVHQRSYKWEEDHVSVLIADVDNSAGSYFMGAMVFTTVNNKPDTLHVADGQQRLATITMLIAAIRDKMIEIGASDTSIDDIERKYLFEYDDQADELKPRLTLNVDDNTFFHEYVLLRPSDPRRTSAKPNQKHQSNLSLQNAASKVREHARKLADTPRKSDKIAALREFVTMLKERIKVVLVIVDDPARAYTIFETLNDRGVRLGQLDLLKVFLFAQADAGGQLDEMRKRWDSMVAALETTADEETTVDYVRHLWMTAHGHVRKEYVFKQIRQEVSTPPKALKFASDLSDSTAVYLALTNPAHPHWDKQGHSERTRKGVYIMARILSVDRMMPLLLAIAKTFKAKEVEKAFELCVAWWVRFMVVGGLGRGDVEEFYANTAKLIHDKEIKDAKALAAAMKPEAPEDKAFELAFRIYRVTKHDLARYLLRALESKARPGTDPFMVPTDDPDRVDLEHVLPRNPSPAWGIGEEDAKALYKRLGNMALFVKRDNSTMQNNTFKVKKPYFENSPITLTEMIYQTPGDDWGETQIDHRQHELAKLALRTWAFVV